MPYSIGWVATVAFGLVPMVGILPTNAGEIDLDVAGVDDQVNFWAMRNVYSPEYQPDSNLSDLETDFGPWVSAIAPSVQRRVSCWELRDAGYLDLDDPKCENVTWSAGVDGIPDENHMLRPRPTAPDADEPPAESVPADVLLEYAVAQVQASGAGVVKQPTWDTLMDVPTLVYVTAPTQTLTTTLFGAEVTVSLEATRFSYDFGDGSAPLVTTDPGAPYPAKRVYHVYGRRQSDVVITLTTTWRGSVTSPFDGSTASLNGVVTTVESTQPFRVCKAHIYTVPLPEERTREEQARLDEFERKSREECNVWNTTPTH